MQMIVNGKVYSGCASPKPFTVVGAQVTWVASPSLIVTDQVIARYRYAVQLPASAKALSTSLYYFAVQGQTVFPLSTPDRFGVSYVLGPFSKVQVSRNGARLTPDDGTGKGAYTVGGNAVTLLWPAGVDEAVTIDVWE